MRPRCLFQLHPDNLLPGSRFPSQERVGGDSKIPTIMYYDQDGKVRAVGAEAMREGLVEIAEDEQWTKAEWFATFPRRSSSI